jgi:hypothetical protein
MGSVGSDQSSLGGSTGGVVDANGALLLSTDTTGETALMFGPSALRAVLAGVANGDIAVPPADPTAILSDVNPLPYWTFTDVNSSGAITATVISDAGAGSGNVLRFKIASGTFTSKSVTLTRYEPVPSSASRSFSFYAEASFNNATNSTQAAAQLTCQFYQRDQVTTTGPAFSSDSTLFSFLTTSTGITAPNLFGVSPSLSNTTAPADAAFLKVTITIATVATQSADRTIDLTEVRITNGSSGMILTDKSTPTNSPAYVINDSGTLSLGDGGGLGALDIGNMSVLKGTNLVSLQATNIEALGDLRVTGYANLEGSSLSRYDKGGSADTTTITTAGTYYALTNAEATFVPQFIGQRWLLTYTGYASLNTTTIQYAFVRADVTDSVNTQIAVLGFGRADNFGQSGRGATVAVTKVWVADSTSPRKIKLYGTTQTTNGLILSLAYTQITAFPIG